MERERNKTTTKSPHATYTDTSRVSIGCNVNQSYELNLFSRAKERAEFGSLTYWILLPVRRLWQADERVTHGKIILY